MLSVIYAECCYAECRLSLVSLMLSVTSSIMPRVIKLNVIMLSVVAQVESKLSQGHYVENVS
jgi:hypothetical protein